MTDKEKDFSADSGEPGTEYSGEGEGAGPSAGSRPEGEDDVAQLRTRFAYGNERLLRAILPFLDNLERAISQAGASGSAEPLVEGVRLTYDHLLAELRKFGLTPIAAEGAMFDPNLHEAIAMVAWEGKPEGTVLAENRKGYVLNGRLLRPAQVTVARPPGPADAGAVADGNGPDRTGRDS